MLSFAPVTRTCRRWARSLVGALVIFGALGCEGYYDTEGESAYSCEGQRIDRIRPRDEGDEAYVDGWVFAMLACPVDSAVITVRTSQGESATGLVNVHHGGRQVRFRPSPRLRTRTPYDAHLETVDGFHDWRFTTSALGEPVGDELAGTALVLRPWTGVLLDPPGLDEQLGDALEDFHPAIQFMTDATGALVQARLGGVSIDDEGDPQDMDRPVIDLEATWDDPFWRFGPIDLTWQLDGFPLVLSSVWISGAVAPGLEGGGGVAIEARWDTRPADDLLGGGPGSLCEAAVEAGLDACEPCDDGEPACMPLHVVHAGANPWFGTLQAL
jgi:hypothetical protein